MVYLTLFACAIAAGWIASIKMGGTAERETMCLLTCIWLGTVVANQVTHSPAPIPIYFALDVCAVGWLWFHRRRNWQWLPTGLFAAMILTHFIFWSGTESGVLVYQGRPYQDVLAILGYLQILSTGIASLERARARRGRLPVVGHWVLSSDWLPRQRSHYKSHEG
jgi:hypothetical protein